MKNYENMRLEELKMLPEDEFDKIPEEILKKAIDEYNRICSEIQRCYVTHDFIVEED